MTGQNLLGALSLGGALLGLSVALPFVASFLIDGSSYLRRRRSAAPLLIVLVATVLLGTVGTVLLLAGLQLASTGDGRADAVRAVTGIAALLLSFAVPLAVLTAGIRRMVRRAHREDERRAEAQAVEEQARLERAVDAMEERVYRGVVTELRARRRQAS